MTDAADRVLAEILTMTLGRIIAPGENPQRAEEPKWDSLKHLEIIFAVESALDVKFSAQEMAEIRDAAGLKAKVSASHAA